MRLLALRAETMQAMRRLKLPCDDITPIGLWGSDMFLIGVNNDQFEVLRLWNVQTEDVTPATLRDLHTESAAIPTSPSAGNAASGARSSAKGAPSAAPTSTPTASAPEARAESSPSGGPAGADASVRPAGGQSATIDRAAVLLDRDSDADVPEPSARGKSAIDMQPASVPAAPVAAPSAAGAGATVARPSDARAKNGSAGSPSVTGTPSEDRGGADLKLDPSSPRSEGKAPEAESKPATDTAKDSGSNAGKLRMTVDGEHLYAEIKGGKIVLKDRTYDSLAHARDSIRRERNKVAVWEYFDEGVKAWRVLNRD